MSHFDDIQRTQIIMERQYQQLKCERELVNSFLYIIRERFDWYSRSWIFFQCTRSVKASVIFFSAQNCPHAWEPTDVRIHFYIRSFSFLRNDT